MIIYVKESSKSNKPNQNYKKTYSFKLLLLFVYSWARHCLQVCIDYISLHNIFASEPTLRLYLYLHASSFLDYRSYKARVYELL